MNNNNNHNNNMWHRVAYTINNYNNTPLHGRVSSSLSLIIMMTIALLLAGVEAEIASSSSMGEGGSSLNGMRELNVIASSNSQPPSSGSNPCMAHKFQTIANSIDDVEDLKLDVPVNIALDNKQKKRFLLYLNASTALSINFSQNVTRRIFFNQTTKLKAEGRNVLLPCALRGQYDIFVLAKHTGSVKIEAHAVQPQSSWPSLALNRSVNCATARGAQRRANCVSIRSQNRVRKRQMIVKWDKSKFDFHAMHYCLVVNTRQRQQQFCNAVHDYIMHNKAGTNSCYPGAIMDYIWQRPPERARKIDPRVTNIICTGRRTQQLLRGVVPNHTYYLDVFGVHTQRQNVTFHLASKQVNFNRTHPVALRSDTLIMKKISGLHGVQLFSFKIPTKTPTPPVAIVSNFSNALPSTALYLRYLIIPCGGGEVNVTFLRQRKFCGEVDNVYLPYHVRIPTVQPGERYMVRFRPSNDDELLRANKVGLAVTTMGIFQHFPEMPQNMTVFELSMRCASTTIAWHSSPEQRPMRYCIIVFNLPQRNRSSSDYTNYCLDFGKRITQHPLFYSIECIERAKSAPQLETHTILNLIPGETYLIYVTANLRDGKALPYQALPVTTRQQCLNEIYDSRELHEEDY